MNKLPAAVDELRENERQWEAFEELGDCVVLAPPGSGKTKLLTTKLAYALATDAVRPPRGAACITMTNEAALELRRRLRALGVSSRPNLFVGTVHAFALSRIVGPFAAAAGRKDIADSRLASDAEYDSAFDTAYKAMNFRGGFDRRDMEGLAKKARSRLDLSGDETLGGEPVALLAQQLQAQLAAQSLYDFHDLVRHAVELVESYEWIGRVLAAEFPLVYVDEYQDLAPGLDRIVRAMTLRAGLDSTLFAVGDPDQAIYAFSGAYPELLRGLASDPTVRTVSLELNYRCGQDIIDASLLALGEDRVVRGQRDGGTVHIQGTRGGEQAMYEMALERIRSAIDRGVPAEQIAVLSPWGSDRDRVVGVLREAGIPVFARTDAHWKTTTLTMLLEELARCAASSPVDGRVLAGLLDSLGSLVPAAREHGPQSRAVRAVLDVQSSSPAREMLTDIAAAALADYLERNSYREDAREVRRMMAAIGTTGPLAEMTVDELGNRARATGHVMASTIHGAKGLEFDVVLIVGVDHAGLPGFNPTEEDIEEGRRKFYVSITRARHEVDLIYPDWRLSRSGNRYDVRPSPFVVDLIGRGVGA